MNTGYVTGPGSPYLRRPTRSLEMVLAQRFEIPSPTGEPAEPHNVETKSGGNPAARFDKD
jgi:hypothetical protein